MNVPKESNDLEQLPLNTHLRTLHSASLGFVSSVPQRCSVIVKVTWLLGEANIPNLRISLSFGKVPESALDPFGTYLAGPPCMLRKKRRTKQDRSGESTQNPLKEKKGQIVIDKSEGGKTPRVYHL